MSNIVDSKNTLPAMDLPDGLILTDLEVQILRKLVSGSRTKEISTQLGIPQSSIVTLLKKPEVKKFVQEMIDARNSALKMELPNLLSRMIEDKIDKLEEDGLTLGAGTNKDIPDLIKQLNELLKTTDSTTEDESKEGFAKIYNQINLITEPINMVKHNRYKGLIMTIIGCLKNIKHIKQYFMSALTETFSYPHADKHIRKELEELSRNTEVTSTGLSKTRIRKIKKVKRKGK